MGINLNELITRIESKLESIGAMAERLVELYEKGFERSKEAKEIEGNIKALFWEIAPLLNEAKEALKIQPDKFVWLKLGDIYYFLVEVFAYYSPDSRLEKECREKAMRCYMEAFVKHMREFPEILKKLGSIPPFSPEDRKAFLAEYEKMVGFALPKEPAFGSNYPEFEAQNKREERQLAELQLKMLKMYLEVCPDDVDALVETAARYAILLENYPGQEEYLEECEALLERALELSPDDLRVLARAYRIYEDVWRCSSGEKRRQLLNKLIELLRKRCEINPTDSFPWIQLSRIYEMYIVTEDRGRDLEEAIRCMEEATKRDCSWRCWQKLGELYLRKGDRERMLECYSKAFEKYVKEKQVNEF